MNSTYIINENSLTLFHNGKVNTVTASHENYPRIKEAIRESDFDKAQDLIDRVSFVKGWCGTDGNFFVEDNGDVKYKTEQLSSSLSKRIIKMAEEGFDTKPLAQFLDNLFLNPSNRAIEELYRFLECNALPITPDGSFMAYKRIRSDWTDCHTGTVDNSVNQIVEMPRNRVNDDCTQTCSHGLHFCSLEYLKAFIGERLVAVKINPRDVVSIPIDYNNSKGRCCRYEVVQELDMALVRGTKDYWNAPVVDDYEDEEEENEEYYECRDCCWTGSAEQTIFSNGTIICPSCGSNNVEVAYQ